MLIYLIKNIIARHLTIFRDEIRRFRALKKYKVKLSENVSLDFSKTSNIGKFSFIGKNVILGPALESIGAFCSIASGVIIGTNNHNIDFITSSSSIFAFDNPNNFVQRKNNNKYNIYKKDLNSKKTKIGNDVWIGHNAIILPGVIIGDGSVVGAGSIVTKNIPPYTIYAGNPAKFIRYRIEPQIISRLLKAEIYNKDLIKLFQIMIKYKNDHLKDCYDMFLKDVEKIN